VNRPHINKSFHDLERLSATTDEVVIKQVIDELKHRGRKRPNELRAKLEKQIGKVDAPKPIEEPKVVDTASDAFRQIIYSLEGRLAQTGKQVEELRIENSGLKERISQLEALLSKAQEILIAKGKQSAATVKPDEVEPQPQDASNQIHTEEEFRKFMETLHPNQKKA